MKTPQVQGIWVDVFELSRFRGKRRRLYGPTEFRSIRSRAVDWGISIDSLIPGPNAYVRLFRAGETEGDCIWLGPQQGVTDAVEVRMDDGIDSVAILGRPPEPGEPGYDAFQTAAGKQKPAGQPRD